MNKNKIILRLFFDFFKIGCFTYGGGWSIVAQMQKLYVEDREMISTDELLDLTGLARSFPGIMIINASMLFGYRIAGYSGGLACMLGLCLSPGLILTAITFFYESFQSFTPVIAAMQGIRAAVVPIIAYAAMTMIKSSVRSLFSVILTAVAFIAYHFYGIGCLWIIVCGAIIGLLMSDHFEKKGVDSNGTS